MTDTTQTGTTTPSVYFVSSHSELTTGSSVVTVDVVLDQTVNGDASHTAIVTPSSYLTTIFILVTLCMVLIILVILIILTTLINLSTLRRIVWQ